MKVKVQSFDAKAKAADVELNDEVFGLDPRADILHRVVTWQLEKRRATARGTRERADVAPGQLDDPGSAVVDRPHDPGGRHTPVRDPGLERAELGARPLDGYAGTPTDAVVQLVLEVLAHGQGGRGTDQRAPTQRSAARLPEPGSEADGSADQGAFGRTGDVAGRTAK